MRLMLPALFAVSITQINLLVDTLIASFLVTGSVSWLYYSDRLVEFPMGVFGIALATVILPNLSQKHAASDPTAFSHTLDWALRLVMLLAVPATLGLLLLAGPVLATLFQYEEFGRNDVTMSARSLMAYSIGLLAFILVKVLAPGYFARQDTKTPVKIGVKAMLANMVFNVILVFPLAHAGLALATSLSAFLNAGLLFLGLRREGVYTPESGWKPFTLRCLLANIGLVAVLGLGVPSMDRWFAWGAGERALMLMLWIGAALVVYLLLLLLAGMRPRHLVREM